MADELLKILIDTIQTGSPAATAIFAYAWWSEKTERKGLQSTVVEITKDLARIAMILEDLKERVK